MAAGRPFMPFYEGVRPVKVAYFDFENDAQDVQKDLRQMFVTFTSAEVNRLNTNMVIIPKGLMAGELFQFNTHEKWANALIQQNGVEFIIVDNVSAAYDLNDENSNAEVTKKVIKPLLKMAYKGNCAFLFAHHYGKAKTELEHAGVHAGRGASALQALSRTVINMFGDVSKGEQVTVECAKRKTDGGQNYREVFELRDDRWFHHTKFAPPPKKRSCSEVLKEYINDNVHYPDTITPADLADLFQDDYKIDWINKSLASLSLGGFITKHGKGEYSSRKKRATTLPKPKNFYDPDDDDDEG
jgi:RecA-family ATPase